MRRYAFCRQPVIMYCVITRINVILFITRNSKLIRQMTYETYDDVRDICESQSIKRSIYIFLSFVVRLNSVLSELKVLKKFIIL